MTLTDLRPLLREAQDMLGTVHTVIQGPDARWVGPPGEIGWFDEDLVPDPACPVCALGREIDEVLGDG